MSLHQLDLSRPGERFDMYLDVLTQAAGHADRVIPMENYTKELMKPIERKSIEPKAARLAPIKVRRIHHIVVGKGSRNWGPPQ